MDLQESQLQVELHHHLVVDLELELQPALVVDLDPLEFRNRHGQEVDDPVHLHLHLVVVSVVDPFVTGYVHTSTKMYLKLPGD